MERNSDLYKKHIIELKNLLEKQIVEGDNSEIVSNLELLALCAFEENRMNKYSFAGYWFSVSCRMLKRYHPTELVRFYMTMYKRAYQNISKRYVSVRKIIKESLVMRLISV